MINEKQKAKELVDKYLSLFKKTDTCFLDNCETKVYCQHSDFKCKGWLQFAKDSAKIAVNELILEHTFANPLAWNIKRKSFWESVLKEIDSI